MQENKTGRSPVVFHGDQGPCYFTFPALTNTGLCRHAFSTRLGGVSRGRYASLSLSFFMGDDRQAVYENYRRLCGAIGVDEKKLVFGDQVHSANVRVVTEADAGKGITRERDYSAVDGLVTNVPGLPLATLYADCVPLLFLDPVKKAVGCSHAGWKGTAASIGRRTVEVMQKAYGSDPADILACIAPSIGPCCYEVDEPLREAFSKIPDVSPEGLLTPKGEGKYMLNLWEANRRILLAAGLKAEHITIAQVCTCCHADVFHSHRATAGNRGSLAAVIALRE